MKVTTVVEFNRSESSYVFNVKLDDVLNVDLDGNTITSFAPTDPAYIEVNMSKNVSITEVAITDSGGSITKLGMVSRSESVTNLFTSRKESDNEEFKLNLIPSSVNISYTGNTGGLMSSLNSIGEWSYSPDISLTPFIAKFDCSYQAISYKLTPPILALEDDETYDVAVVFYIKVD